MTITPEIVGNRGLCRISLTSCMPENYAELRFSLLDAVTITRQRLLSVFFAVLTWEKER